MRDAMRAMGGDPDKINPLVAGRARDRPLGAGRRVRLARRRSQRNAELEFERNQERYAFLRWGQGAFDNFQVVPPDTGIVHQVNLEYLARVVFVDDGARPVAYPDTLVGTDSHTTMINGLGVLGWGVGGIEAEAAMLGQPMSMLIPQVLGFKLTGKLHEGATATDLVLTVTEMLRKQGVVGKFVEFYGAGLARLPLADRATIGNMSPEFGSTCAIFPIDAETLRYLEFSGRPKELIDAGRGVRQGAGAVARRGLRGADVHRHARARPRRRSSRASPGPKRPQDRVSLTESKAAFRMALEGYLPDEDRRGRRARRELPGERPGRHARPERRGPGPSGGTGGTQVAERRARRVAGHARRRDRDRARPRPRRDRRDHQLHEHLEPVGDARRRASWRATPSRRG